MEFNPQYYSDGKFRITFTSNNGNNVSVLSMDSESVHELAVLLHKFLEKAGIDCELTYNSNNSNLN